MVQSKNKTGFVAALLAVMLLLAATVTPAAAQTGTPEEEMLAGVARAMNRYHEIQNAYQAVQRGEIPAVIAEELKRKNQPVNMETARSESESLLLDAQDNLEENRVRCLSQKTGEPEAVIQAMRQSGKGWGRIARDLGVHPSALGLGNSAAKARASAKKTGKGAGASGQGSGKNKVKTKGKGKNK